MKKSLEALIAVVSLVLFSSLAFSASSLTVITLPSGLHCGIKEGRITAVPVVMEKG